MTNSDFITEECLNALRNITQILGEEQFIKLSEILCTKYDLAGSVRSQLKEAILDEAKKKGKDFYSEAEFTLSDYFSHDYDNLESEDDIFKKNTARIDLMFEQMLDDAVVLDTVGNVEIQETLSKFSEEEQKSILQNIRDEDIKEFVQDSLETRLAECKQKYKWYRNYCLRLKRIERRLALKDFLKEEKS